MEKSQKTKNYIKAGATAAIVTALSINPIIGTHEYKTLVDLERNYGNAPVCQYVEIPTYGGPEQLARDLYEKNNCE